MPYTLLRCARIAVSVVCVGGTWTLARRVDLLPWHLVSTSALILAIMVACTILLQRVRHEDRVARIEAARWRAQYARNRAALARTEVELQLFEVGAVDGWHDGDPAGMSSRTPLAQVQAELMRLQQKAAWTNARRARGVRPDGMP